MVTFSRTSMIALLYRVSRFWRMIGWLSSDPRSRVWFHVPRRTPAARRANMRSDSARLKFRTLTAIVDIVGSIRCRVWKRARESLASVGVNQPSSRALAAWNSASLSRHLDFGLDRERAG